MENYPDRGEIKCSSYLAKIKTAAAYEERVDKDKVCECVNVCCQLKGTLWQGGFCITLHFIKFIKEISEAF